jgi:hypothetical protein
MSSALPFRPQVPRLHAPGPADVTSALRRVCGGQRLPTHIIQAILIHFCDLHESRLCARECVACTSRGRGKHAKFSEAQHLDLHICIHFQSTLPGIWGSFIRVAHS